VTFVSVVVLAGIFPGEKGGEEKRKREGKERGR